MALRFTTVLVLATSLVGTIQAGDNDAAILQAIKYGQEYLKQSQQKGGGGGIPAASIVGIGGNGRGTGCLTGLALIESGLDASDKTVAALARDARNSALATTATYEISLTIMFLDRLGLKDDEGLIQFLTLRLMSGQTPDGGWTYTCGLKLNPVEERQLAAELLRQPKLVTPDTPITPKKKGPRPREDIDVGPKKPKKDKPTKTSPKPDSKSKLHPALEKYAEAIKKALAPVTDLAWMSDAITPIHNSPRLASGADDAMASTSRMRWWNSTSTTASARTRTGAGPIPVSVAVRRHK